MRNSAIQADFRLLVAPLLKQSECSAVGSALRSGRRGRAFESPHSDKAKGNFLEYSKLPFISIQSLEQNQDGYVIKQAQFENLGELVKNTIFVA